MWRFERCRTPPQAPADLPQDRKPLIFEPGPIYLAGPLRDQTLDEIVELGVDTVRVTVYWNDAAPETEPSRWDPADAADPSYDFAQYDEFVRAAADRNLKLLMTIAGPAPLWGSRAGNELTPDPDRFGEFAAAVAGRYRGRCADAGRYGTSRTSRSSCNPSSATASPTRRFSTGSSTSPRRRRSPPPIPVPRS